MEHYLFPFNLVHHDAHIILYGAGRVGQTYLHQVRMTQYCHVVCIIDRRYDRYASLPVDVCPVEQLPSKEYDMIVIANDTPSIVKEVYDLLVNQYCVPKEKIIHRRDRVKTIYPLCDEKNYVLDEELSFSKKECFSVAVKMCGGFGDYIVRKKNLHELTQWDPRLSIDIYVDAVKHEFSKVLFSDLTRVNAIVPAEMEYYVKKEQYLAAMRFDTMLHMDVLNNSLLKDLPKGLRERFLSVQGSCEAYGLEDDGLLYSVHFARCEKDGLNCYTSYNRHQGFHVTDFHTTIPMVQVYEGQFLALHLGRYITLNYGWGKDTGSERVSAKVWPLEYFSQLVNLFKVSYPDVKIVQIGMADSAVIEGCDHYVFGQNIELVKYVLKNSQLHVDCEGGMVHLATQLGTKCVVLFGPTPWKYYGYDVNANIVSDACTNCCWLVSDFFSCYRGMEQPECMYSIDPSTVMDRIKEYFTPAF